MSHCAGKPGLRTAALLLAALGVACSESRTVLNGPASQATAQMPAAAGETVTQTLKFIASDSAELHVILRSTGDFSPKPLIVEVGPYGGASGVPEFGLAYTHVYVHARGTGNSTGSWSAVGPRDQQDVAEVLAWACAQPWSNGHIGLYGFSASAIAIYNSMHLPLACVDAAALMAGTNDLYRDLLVPGGMQAVAPEVVVGFGVGLPLMLSAPDRIAAVMAGQSPAEPLMSGVGILQIAADIAQHPTEDQYWLDRTQRAGPNQFPVLANTGFYDVESRGPFQSYQMLRDLGVPVHLRVFGAHDGTPAGTAGPFPEYQRWFDRYLLGVDNGIDREPRVQFLIGHGGYEAQLLGAVTKYEAVDWPVPGTRWQTLHLDGTRGGGASSINDGQLATAPVSAETQQAYPAVFSFPLATDPNTSSTITNGGAQGFAAFPFLTWQLLLAEPFALTYTTQPLSQDVDVVGPAALDLYLTTAALEADLYAVLADVDTDGMAHAVGIGRIRTSFPHVIEERSLHDENGVMVQPYPDHSAKTLAAPGEQRLYQVEFWPVGNRFQAGHRLRLYLVGAPSTEIPAPSLNLAAVGGGTPSRIHLPVLPGQDLCAALGATHC